MKATCDIQVLHRAYIEREIYSAYTKFVRSVLRLIDIHFHDLNLILQRTR